MQITVSQNRRNTGKGFLRFPPLFQLMILVKSRLSTRFCRAVLASDVESSSLKASGIISFW